MHARKKLVVVIELEPKYGGISLAKAKAQLSTAHSQFAEWGLARELKMAACLGGGRAGGGGGTDGGGLRLPTSEEMQEAVFGKATVVLEWSRFRSLQNALLIKIAEAFVKPPATKASWAAQNKARMSACRQTPHAELSASLGEASAGASERRETEAELSGASGDASFGRRRRSLCGRQSANGVMGAAHDVAGAAAGAMSGFLASGASGVFALSDITREPLHLFPLVGEHQYHIYCSPLNEGADEVLREVIDLKRLDSELKVCRNPDDLAQCDQMLVYLRADTWSAPTAEGFAEEVLRAMRLRKAILLTYEDMGVDKDERKGAIIERLIASTPESLVNAELYSIIAVPLRGTWLRPASLAMLAKVLNAVIVRKQRARTFCGFCGLDWLRPRRAEKQMPQRDSRVFNTDTLAGLTAFRQSQTRGRNYERLASEWGSTVAAATVGVSAATEATARANARWLDATAKILSTVPPPGSHADARAVTPPREKLSLMLRTSRLRSQRTLAATSQEQPSSSAPVGSSRKANGHTASYHV